jgi:hypothetical protein
LLLRELISSAEEMTPPGGNERALNRLIATEQADELML